jgi:hypothetical protein
MNNKPDQFPCARCPLEGEIYQIVPHPGYVVLMLRCVGCGLEWSVRSGSGEVKPLPSRD